MIAKRARRAYRGASIQCLEQMCQRFHAAAEMPNGNSYNYFAPDGTGTVTLNMTVSRALELAITMDLVNRLANNANDLLAIVEGVIEHPSPAVADAFQKLLTVYELSKNEQ